jgi:penicillin-binding protein 1A
MKNEFRISTLAGILILSFFLGLGLSTLVHLNRTLPSPSLLEEYSPPSVTRLFDDRGKLIYEFYEEKRIPVKLEDIPHNAIEATIAVEDRSFYRHSGISLYAIFRAFLKNIIARRSKEGGSTITQQLARNLFLTKEKSFIRKLKEAILSLKIERYYSKDEILELYFNQIYYGNGCYGIESAARRYFNKGISSLSFPECALLVGLPRAPSLYDPFTHPGAALWRRAIVLEAMAEVGAVSRSRAERAKNAPLGLAENVQYSNIGPYFVEEVRKWVSERFGSDIFYQGGFSIYTSLDREWQKIADGVVKKWLENLEGTLNSDSTSPLQGALLAMDPRTGYIKAMVGGRDFRKSQFNRSTQAKRQPGSAFKPFLYSTAIDNGYTPAALLLDGPIVVEVGDTVYSPSNYDETFKGPILMRDAIALSRNLASVRLIMRVGPEKVVNYARRMGIETNLIPVISLALGSNSVSLLEMVTGYSTLANHGIRIKPMMITRIEDRDGRTVYEAKPFSERIISREVTYIVTSMMESVFQYGTARGARRMGFHRPAAGKTGTTNHFTDAWFVGFTPRLCCGVWVGYDSLKTIREGASGAVFALPIWVDFMKNALEDSSVRNFELPPGIIRRKICEESGLLATPFCPKVRDEVFITGTEPTDSCSIHSAITRKRVKSIEFGRLDANKEKKEF